jgi:hypothetical protein
LNIAREGNWIPCKPLASGAIVMLPMLLEAPRTAKSEALWFAPDVRIE